MFYLLCKVVDSYRLKQPITTQFVKRRLILSSKILISCFQCPYEIFGKCFKLDVNNEVMPYGVYTYENVSMGACSIQSALDILKDDGKQQFLDNLGKWDCLR